MIMFYAREAFFLRCGHDFAINNQTGGGIVIEGGNAENTYHRSASELEQRIDEGRDSRTLCQHEQSSHQNQGYHDRRQPILLVFSHELPEFAHDLCFRHLESLPKIAFIVTLILRQ